MLWALYFIVGYGVLLMAVGIVVGLIRHAAGKDNGGANSVDEQTLLVLRLLGYLLNIAILITVAAKYRQHWLALGAWVLWLAVIATAVLLRYAGYPEGYFQVIDWISTPLLYVNAAVTAYVLLSYKGGNNP